MDIYNYALATACAIMYIALMHTLSIRPLVAACTPNEMFKGTFFPSVVLVALNSYLAYERFAWLLFMAVFVYIFVWYLCYTKGYTYTLSLYKRYLERKEELNHSIFRGPHAHKTIADILGPSPIVDDSWKRHYRESVIGMTVMLSGACSSGAMLLFVILANTQEIAL